MIHWFIFNFVVMLVSGLVLIEYYFRTQIDFLPILAGILFLITFVIFIKDIFMLKGH